MNMRVARWFGGILLAGLAAIAAAQPAPQKPLPDASQTSNSAPLHRTRLILKDGSYQLVMSYTVKGKIVSYVSAERGEVEQVPADLVDWDATHKWEHDHAARDDAEAPGPQIDPELLKEEQERRSLNPEVAPNLNLPDQDSVVALDYYQGTPELVPLTQSDGELNRTTSHNVLKFSINPRSASHQILALKGESATVQMHVPQPEIYVRVGDESGISRGGGAPFVVDTHGAASSKQSVSNDVSSPNSGYVLVRADVRTDSRVLASFNIGALNNGMRRQEDVVETATELLPGGHWMKVTPKQPLDFGEYALMEVLSDRDVNLGVWDFGVHPVEPENRDVIKPEPKRPVELEHRR
jgi:hypothetical protein